MEINLQFDNEGRTRSSATVTDYSTKAIMTTLGTMDAWNHDCVPSNSDGSLKSEGDCDPCPLGWLDQLLHDCEIADSALMPHTFWMPAVPNLSSETNNQDLPKCSLEQMALEIFHHHVANLSWTEEELQNSGAEWWVQIRPSLHPSESAISRQSQDTLTLGQNQTHIDASKDMSQSGIDFHWDKDEELRHLAGGNLYVHPHLSTVTYLTSNGAPTIICHQRIHAFTGEWIIAEEDSCVGYLSWPVCGKHLSFDGGFLHAAPSDLLETKQWEKESQASLTKADESNNEKMRVIRRHRRVTFLVNIWLNYKPLNVQRFPEGMLHKMSRVNNPNWKLFDSSKPMPTAVIDVARQQHITTFTWPMGCEGSSERITAPIPIEKIRENAQEGTTICLQWSKDAPLVLSRGDNHVQTKRARTE